MGKSTGEIREEAVWKGAKDLLDIIRKVLIVMFLFVHSSSLNINILYR